MHHKLEKGKTIKGKRKMKRDNKHIIVSRMGLHVCSITGYLFLCEIWGSHGGDYERYPFLTGWV
jgi:hypothetical protein